MKRIMAVAATALALIGTPLVAFAQDQMPQGQQPAAQVTGTRTARGVVTNVDTKNDVATIRGMNGREIKVEVDPNVAQKLKKGDQVELNVQLTVTRPSP